MSESELQELMLFYGAKPAVKKLLDLQSMIDPESAHLEMQRVRASTPWLFEGRTSCCPGEVSNVNR